MASDSRLPPGDRAPPARRDVDAEFEAELLAMLSRWGDREPPEDGRRREPFFFAHGIPARP